MTEHTEASSPTRQFAPLAIILGIPLIFAAIFFYTTPVTLVTGGDQGIFKCGSPSSPNSDADNVCAQPEKTERNKAIYSGLSGAGLVALGSVWLLRGQRRDDDEWDDERPRRRSDEIDLRTDADERRGGDEPLRGARRERRADADSRSRRRDEDEDLDLDADEPRAPRRDEARRSRRDDDLDSRSRRRDDDWSSDGWR
ncbi:hypothetical protein [Janibacter sp. YB324]|uniref:hypothetical protein n=1 Tax=Janibacter sp. YB324 TaxID=2761047 RepID=UPI001624C585|nr:hypothetical protein [Janibacter sp. YB324]QNF92906.1 hypothetical protein H7A72_08655 [Janibacter sp. YB324]